MKDDFIFGTATAAYQIEGAISEDGRTPSIWDAFTQKPGAVKNGDNGSVACNNYHLYREDIELMHKLGTDSYRFSISWPRIFPENGKYNPEGMKFYKNVVARLKEKGIKAAVTIYHWDLPMWAQQCGGWLNRECAGWFVEFASKCFEELDGDVDMWITHNEPWCASFLSYHTGEHAPGHHNLQEAVAAAHNILLSHGMAVKKYRELGGKHRIGITLNLMPVYARTDSTADRLAARMRDGYQNRWFLEPIFKRNYPEDMLALFAARTAADYDFIREGDMSTIGMPVDFIGINYYTRGCVEYSPESQLLNKGAASELKKTDMDWDVCPDALEDILREVRTYTSIPIYITENGSAWKDTLKDGAVHDAERTDYLMAHLNEVEKLNREGFGIAGYFCWSFMDNFEWAYGYSERFGLVYVDYKTQKRIPKDSFYAYRDFISEYKKNHREHINLKTGVYCRGNR